MPKNNIPQLYRVEWEETHVYKYVMLVLAASTKEANQKANSGEDDDERYCGFDRVKSIGRKKASIVEN